MMFFGLFAKKNNNKTIVERQYAALTDAARQPYLYTDLDVPDTVMGRFEMLCATLILYFRRTRLCGRSGQEIAQEIIDAFFEDVDHSIRELGVGDLSVPKRMKKLASMFYGRLESYSKAIEAGDAAALAAALKRNFYPRDGEAPLSMQGLADYLLDIEKALAVQDDGRVEAGLLGFPIPHRIEQPDTAAAPATPLAAPLAASPEERTHD